MANIIKTKGIVLNTMPFKESSLFASILTRRFGKIRILAKGVRRPKSKFCGTLEPFNLDEIIFYKRESKELYTLSDAVIINNFEKVRTHPNKVNAAMVICEFFEKTLPMEESDNNTYALLLKFLLELQDTDEFAVRTLTFYYLLRALIYAGVMPHLDNCVKCHNSVEYNKRIDFSIGAGGVVCERDFDDTVVVLNPETINTLRQIYSNKDINLGKIISSEIEKFVPDYLYYHLNNLILNSLKHLK